MKISAYTDGSFSAPYGGFGVLFIGHRSPLPVKKEFVSKRYTGTTNNRMELKAIIKVLEQCKPGHQIDIYSDSQYCVKSANEWLENWVSSGKLESKQNPDLWKRFINAKEKHIKGKSKLNITWVRGHSLCEFNKIADKLANKARLIDNKKETVECKSNN